MDPSLLKRIAQDLEHHPECDRIKKLIHWVCTATWCQDPQTLAAGPLITGLVAKASTQESMQTLLLDGAHQLNKQKKYTQIGQLIIQILAPVYPVIQSTVAASPPPPLSSPLTPQPVPTPMGQSSSLATDYDLFEVRLAVLKYTIPLKAKILMSAVLDQQVLLHPKHWLVLKQSSLDEQLRRLYQVHSSFADLEHNLMVAAEKLAALEQIGQVVEAVRQAFKPLYQVQALSPSCSRSPLASPQPAAALPEELDDMISVILPPEDRAAQDRAPQDHVTRDNPMSTQCWPSLGNRHGR